MAAAYDKQEPTLKTGIELLWQEFEGLSDELNRLGERLGPIRVAGRGQLPTASDRESSGLVGIHPPHSQLYERVDALAAQLREKAAWIHEVLLELEL